MMLVLSVSDGNRVYIGDSFITLVEAQNGKARIGFDFDDSVPIEREKVRERRLKAIDEAAREVT